MNPARISGSGLDDLSTGIPGQYSPREPTIYPARATEIVAQYSQRDEKTKHHAVPTESNYSPREQAVCPAEIPGQYSPRVQIICPATSTEILGQDSPGDDEKKYPSMPTEITEQCSSSETRTKQPAGQTEVPRHFTSRREHQKHPLVPTLKLDDLDLDSDCGEITPVVPYQASYPSADGLLSVPSSPVDVDQSGYLHDDPTLGPCPSPCSDIFPSPREYAESRPGSAPRCVSPESSSIGCLSPEPSLHRSGNISQLSVSSQDQPSSLSCATLKSPNGSKGFTSPRSPFMRSTPSPAVSARGWRPVLPGYSQPKDDGQSVSSAQTVVIQRTVQMGGQQQQQQHQEMTSLRDVIPAMPYLLALGCLLLNVICPGLGTFVSGLSVLCVSKKRYGRLTSGVIWLNSWVALFQLLLTPLMLLGWIWSVKWGILFVTISEAEYDKEPNNEERNTDETGIPETHQHRYRFQQASQHITTTTVSLPEGGESHDTVQPIIVLQEAPVYIQRQDMPDLRASLPRRPRGLNPYNPRHQRILRQQNTFYEEDVPSVLLNADTLEDIVIRNGVPLSDVPMK